MAAELASNRPTEPIAVGQSPMSPLSFLDRSSLLYPDKIAITDGANHSTYRQFAERCDRLAKGLAARGLAPGDRVAFLAPNTAPLLEAHFGVPAAGGVLVAINTRLAPPEIRYILEHSGARFLFVDAELAALVPPPTERPPTLETVIPITETSGPSGSSGTPDYDRFLEETPITTPLPALEDENAVISINYTSGTTGRPKGVMYTHRGSYLNAIGEILETSLGSDSVYLWTLPMFHCNGWCHTWGVTAAGGTHVLLRKFDPARAWELIDRLGVTHFCGAPIVLLSLVEEPTRRERLTRPLHATVAAAPPSPTLLEKVERLGISVTHVYGLTETYGPHTVCREQPSWRELPPDEHFRRRARQGIHYLIAERVRVVDEAMRDVPADGHTIGEVVMRGNNVMKGYFRDPEGTVQAFRGGWFHSGDLGVMHADGYIELKDRGKDIIITGGENVSSIEVEQVLGRHPAVLEVAVIGVPHRKWGETPKAFIAARAGAQVTAEELLAHCRQHLAGYKCPTSVVFAELPKTSTGKIQKYLLREQEWAGREKKIQGA